MATPYDNDDTRLWSVERRVTKMELTMDSIDSRLDRVEESVRDLRNSIWNWTLFFGVLIIVSNGIIGAML